MIKTHCNIGQRERFVRRRMPFVVGTRAAFGDREERDENRAITLYDSKERELQSYNNIIPDSIHGLGVSI